MKTLSLCNKIKLEFAKLHHMHKRTPYRFGSNDKKCCISFLNTTFCLFEDITKSHGKVHVGHFSVNEPFRGRRIGEQCLRKFAAHISQLDPTINVIEFSLYKLPTNFPHQKIAQARFNLLQRIGTSNTVITPLPQGKFRVDGTWGKNNWK